MQVYKQPDEAFLRQILDALPFAALVVDSDVRIEFANRTAERMVDPREEPILHKRSGEALGCLHSKETPDGCGHSHSCADCIIRGSVTAAFSGHGVTRRRTFFELRREAGTQEVPMMVTANPFSFRDKDYCILVLEDISELINLQELLPICSQCKKIRDDKNYWHHVEQYVSDHVTDVSFTHSLCPDCVEKLYPNHAARHHKKMVIGLPE